MSASHLKIGGELVGNAILELVEVTQELNQHWWCCVECHQTEDERFPFEKCLGADLQIVTYDESGAEHVLFDGFVLESELDYKIFGNYGARLLAVTRSYAMDTTPRQACYSTSALTTIATQLAARAGLSATVVAPSKASPLQYVQWGETDFAFLRRIIDDHGAWLRPTNAGLEIRNSFAAGVKAQFRVETQLLHFRMTGRLGQPAFDGCHYDARTMESQTFQNVKQAALFSGASEPLVDAVKSQSAARLQPGYGYQRARCSTLADYQQRLALESQRTIGSKVVGYGVSRIQELKAGDRIDIEGVIDAAGTYGLYKVVHRWNREGYENEFWCTPWETWMSPQAPKMPQWHGVVPARVVEHSDPEHFGRYRIRFYWQEDGEPMLWARMLTPHAGRDRGIFFQPEIGDEVAVAFEDGDVERPIILGAIWNGVDTAPTEDFWGGEYSANDVKRIVTKSGNRIQIVDKSGKEAIALATPHSTKVTLLENADETGRSMIHLSNDNGDIFLSAPNGRIHFRSKYFSRESGE
jgi:uncharacterized protein involved in type VI secretion and phage assembly